MILNKIFFEIIIFDISGYFYIINIVSLIFRFMAKISKGTYAKFPNGGFVFHEVRVYSIISYQPFLLSCTIFDEWCDILIFEDQCVSNAA